FFQNGIYLRYSCGVDVRFSIYNLKHKINCNRTEFILHKLDLFRAGTQSNPRCILCKIFPTTAIDYAHHLYTRHQSTLKSNGIYLRCSCGGEVYSYHRYLIHNGQCDGSKFTIQQVITKIPTTPQCILCEAHPKTANGYAIHLQAVHQTTLTSNGIYLLCSCGKEYRAQSNSGHNMKCNGLQFSLHNVVDKIPTTPQCILCEKFPTSALGYAAHLATQHKSTLKANGIFLLCSCGLAVRSPNVHPNHRKDVSCFSSFLNCRIVY
ncbi:hypothetical protein PENTCL1PPCAC_12949, partial [Pristionchus entomophagus]